MADALDLRHRLPLTWAALQAGSGEVWVARKVAATSRWLGAEEVGVVDAAVAGAITTLTPGRVLRLAEAKIIEADPEGHQERLSVRLRRRMVALSPADPHAARTLFARMDEADAVFVDAVVDQVARLLKERRHLVPDLPDETTLDELRAVALGWLAHPEKVLDLLDGVLDHDPHAEPDPDPDPESDADPTADPAPARREPRSVVHFFLHASAEAMAAGEVGLVRGDGVDLPPMLLSQVAGLARHSKVAVHPVIDLREGGAVDAYEHPESMKMRVHLRSPGEAFPHSNRVTRLLRQIDLDHPVPFDPGGPPGQTGDHNAAKLGRTSHRAKTHHGFAVHQVGLDHYLWRSPHGLLRLVGPHGTQSLDTAQARRLVDPGHEAVLSAALQRVHAERGTTLPTPQPTPQPTPTRTLAGRPDPFDYDPDHDTDPEWADLLEC